MNSIALSVNEENWPAALEAATASGCVGGLAAPVNLLMNSVAFHLAVAKGDLHLSHAIRPMGGNAERYLYESGGSKRNRILGQWVRVLSPLGPMGVGSVAVDPEVCARSVAGAARRKRPTLRAQFFRRTTAAQCADDAQTSPYALRDNRASGITASIATF